ncbi:hypothetical protein CPB84DRAFT_1331485 [Gymnopilus junonius]|uniref:Uncharacterized protein n=1 Tax=Gymnopilus junonius TaxID=109634 RepID=A0A9P5NL96_GYMJU|nr:hypothetical protein CPB84DRAFT_1331485 [Gymnopilus junonius]
MLEKIKYENEVYDEKGGDYTRDFRSEQFYKTEYELVVLHPKHFLPIGSTLAMHVKDPDEPNRVSGKLYMTGNDGVLREGRNVNSARFGGFPGPQRHSAQFGAFPGPQRRSKPVDNRLNPFFVILNADMAFRRFERSFPGVSLPKVYQDLLDLTSQVADQIYHAPVVQQAVRKARDSYDATKYRLQASKGAGGNNEDVDMADVDEHGVLSSQGQGASTSLTPRAGGQGGRRMAERYSRFGQAVEEPGPNATAEDLRDYSRYLLSGRGMLIFGTFVKCRF